MTAQSHSFPTETGSRWLCRPISHDEAMQEAVRHDCGLMQAHYRIRSREYLKQRIRARRMKGLSR